MLAVSFKRKYNKYRNLILEQEKEFEKFRFELDDDFRNGDLSAPFYIFNVYLKRYNEFINFALAQAKSKFNFNQDDTYTFDREKMPWASSAASLNSIWKKRVKYELVNLKIAGTPEEKNAETWRAMEDLYKAGKIRAIGVSNFRPHH